MRLATPVPFLQDLYMECGIAYGIIQLSFQTQFGVSDATRSLSNPDPTVIGRRGQPVLRLAAKAARGAGTVLANHME